MQVKVRTSEKQRGWFEFRLGVPEEAQSEGIAVMTQSRLDENILKIDDSTPGYPAILNHVTGSPQMNDYKYFVEFGPSIDQKPWEYTIVLKIQDRLQCDLCILQSAFTVTNK